MSETVFPRLHEALPPNGLTVLVDPDEPSLDIVFVHGFTGHPEKTWIHRGVDARLRNGVEGNESAEPPSKVRRLNPFTNLHQGSDSFQSAVYWPRDLVPVTIPGARVLTYGYDTHVRHLLGPPVSKGTVYDIAWDFLVSLEAERRLGPSRPVVLIAHSLGGIVVKEMLRRSSGCQLGQTHLRSIFESTIGIMFFGTPHSGADPLGLPQRIVEKIIKISGWCVNDQIVNTLLPSAERLRELRDEFSPMAHQQKWIIHSFQEQLGVKLLSGRKVVEDISSYLNFPAVETAQHIEQNHMDMCRFTGLEDSEYKKVAAALRRMTEAVPKQPRGGQSLNEEQRRMLLDSLRFDQIDTRYMTIKNAHAKTCKWLLKNPEYLDWLNITKQHEHYGFLWIKGKPGTGKSTLMKFALANARRAMKDRIIISFFFNARGAVLEKSTVGMYRSLLLQLLERLPELRCDLDSLGLTARGFSESLQWSIESLKELFGQLVQSLGKSSLACFIDALDECDEHLIRDMVSFFEHLGDIAISAGIQLHVCFSSRHYPHITMSRGLGLDLEGQEEHNQDIANYLDSELKIGHDNLAQQIRAELQEKSSGIFMWVVLVVQILNREHDGGRIHALRRRLRDIPNDLHSLFGNILVRDNYNRNELLLCIQWVLFASRPLKPEELYLAILCGSEPEDLARWNREEITMDTIKKFILNSSKGLAEITTSKTPTVQFIHESVTDFLLKENGFRELWSDLGSGFRGQSHERLKQCCLTYISIDISTYLNIGKPLPKASSREYLNIRHSVAEGFPFLEYAVHYVLYHADAAEGGGVIQRDFIQSFQLASWIKLDNFFQKYEIRRHKLSTSLLYILAEGNLSNLIKIHPSNLSYLEIEDERYEMPLFAALATESDSAVRAFMELEVESQPTESHLRHLYDQYCLSRNRFVYGRSFEFSRRLGISGRLAQRHQEILGAFLVETGKEIDTDGNKFLGMLLSATGRGDFATVKTLLRTKSYARSRDRCGQATLLDAVSRGFEEISKLLLEEYNVDPDLTDGYGRTPLSYAAQRGFEGIFKLLLEKYNVDPDSRDNSDRTPLSYAAGRGGEAISKLLLEKYNVDPNSRDSSGRTPLSYAAEQGLEAISELLLGKYNVDPDSRDNRDRTPLSYAAGLDSEAISKLLLEKYNVDPDSRDSSCRTPLSYAAEQGLEAISKLLLEKYNVDADLSDVFGRTPLSYAAEQGSEGTSKLLLEKFHSDPNQGDGRGWTPLLYAAIEGSETISKLLLETYNVDPDQRSISGHTPLLVAMGHRDASKAKRVVQLLLGTGKVDPCKLANYGTSPLLEAQKMGPDRQEIAEMVLAYAKGYRATEILVPA